jgi:branched-chain amino acid transport system ATP-binding protein
MLLEARDVTKAFGSFKAVDRASVTLEQGDILGLIGPNGAGKSTLFNCLTGDLLSTSGKVLLEGHDITNLTPEARAHLGLARTFQVPQTFEGKIARHARPQAARNRPRAGHRTENPAAR